MAAQVGAEVDGGFGDVGRASEGAEPAAAGVANGGLLGVVVGEQDAGWQALIAEALLHGADGDGCGVEAGAAVEDPVIVDLS